MSQSDASTILEESVNEKEDVKEPRLYKVLLHNDNITTMQFVVQVLCEIFNKPPLQATRIMLRVHHNGVGLCGVYPREIAETRVSRVRKAASQAGFPLKCTMEEE